jgi:hypothetical protein
MEDPRAPRAWPFELAQDVGAPPLPLSSPPTIDFILFRTEGSSYTEKRGKTGSMAFENGATAVF